jgi:glyoxylase-like metal-dependent hydrolase (beta-lactamase superfamily II)
MNMTQENRTPFSIDTLELGMMENLIYLIHDHATQRAAVVDPAWEVSKIVALAQKKQIRITDVLLTHSHYDHVNGLQELLKHYDAQIHLLKAEATFWGQWAGLFEKPSLHQGGDKISLGSTTVEIWHTPGHTPGSACYYLDGHILTGDTLFVFGCGRCDLQGGDSEQMHQSLKHLVQALPAKTVIHPGHHYAEQLTSTMEEQIKGNPFMQFGDNHLEFTKYRLVDHDQVRQTPYTAVSKNH